MKLNMQSHTLYSLQRLDGNTTTDELIVLMTVRNILLNKTRLVNIPNSMNGAHGIKKTLETMATKIQPYLAREGEDQYMKLWLTPLGNDLLDHDGIYFRDNKKSVSFLYLRDLYAEDTCITMQELRILREHTDKGINAKVVAKRTSTILAYVSLMGKGFTTQVNDSPDPCTYVLTSSGKKMGMAGGILFYDP